MSHLFAALPFRSFFFKIFLEENIFKIVVESMWANDALSFLRFRTLQPKPPNRPFFDHFALLYPLGDSVMICGASRRVMFALRAFRFFKRLLIVGKRR